MDPQAIQIIIAIALASTAYFAFADGDIRREKIKDTRDITWLPAEEGKDEKEIWMDHVTSYDATYVPLSSTKKERDEFFRLK